VASSGAADHGSSSRVGLPLARLSSPSSPPSGSPASRKSFRPAEVRHRHPVSQINRRSTSRPDRRPSSHRTSRSTSSRPTRHLRMRRLLDDRHKFDRDGDLVAIIVTDIAPAARRRARSGWARSRLRASWRSSADRLMTRTMQERARRASADGRLAAQNVELGVARRSPGLARARPRRDMRAITRRRE